MNDAPTKDAANAEMKTAELSINYHSPDFEALETWLGWRRYSLALQVLAEKDEQQAEKLHGQASMCQELILLIKDGRKGLANSSVK